MRTRTTLAAGALALVATFALAGPVAAQEGGSDADVEELKHEAVAVAEDNGATEEDVECLEMLIDGDSPDDCQEAPSPILPPANELIWGSISFTLLFLALAKFAYPAIKKAMEERSEKIRADLEAAEGAKSEAEGVLSEYRSQVSNAKSEAARIIEEARQQADAMKKEQEQRLQTELAGMRERAAADIEGAKTQAVADLRNEVAELAVGAAEVVVQRNLDPATQRQLVDQYIDSLGSN